MDRKIVALAVAFALIVHSGDAVKCYICNSLTERTCEVSSDLTDDKLTHCSLESMNRFHHDGFQNNDFRDVAHFFSTPKDGNPEPQMVCAKMIVTMSQVNATFRTCQTAPDPDLCVTARNQMHNRGAKPLSLVHCSLCGTDKCNGAAGFGPSMLQLLATMLASVALVARGVVA